MPGSRTRGQALTEFLLVSLALIPLFLLLPMIGKYQDINHATQMASRYAAFDAILRNDSQNSWKPPAQLEAEVRQRFFGMAGAAIVSVDAATEPAMKPYWNDPYGNALIRAPEDIRLSFGASAGAEHADAYAGASDTQPFPLAGLAGLGSGGIYRANVAVTLANLPAGLRNIEPFDTLNLTIRRHASVLPDPWTSSSPQQTETRLGKLAPVNEVMPESLIAAAVTIVDLNSVKPPNFGELAKWRDIVPQDRLRAREQP
jgi:hypothetical protein